MSPDQEPRIAVAPDEGEQARADVYRLLGALLVAPPDAALLSLVRAIEPDEAAATEMTEAWHALRAAAERTTPEAVKQEYFDLFVGLGRGELVPYASWYIHGLLMEKVLAALRGDLRRIGIERREQVAEPEDHAAALCEIMGMIISDSELLLDQSVFYETYIGSWMNRFFDDLGTADSAGFYRAVGNLGSRFMVIERKYFALPV